VIVGSSFQFFQINRVVCLVLEELIDELGALDAVLVAGDLGKVEVRNLAREQGLVQRPFGQRELEVAIGTGRGARPQEVRTRQAQPYRSPPAKLPLRNDRRFERASFIELDSRWV
jgi:hypothetical protein